MRKLCLIILLFPFLLFSQKKDLKVGLALSGGGAKGMAHIAVLKAIEKAGVRVDYIAGTSFGAVIGSLYASGYTANEIDSIAKSIDFKSTLEGKIPRKNQPFKYEELEKDYVVSLPLVNFQLEAPIAFSYGQGIQNLMTELTRNVNHITDFSQLPIPFLCIATNLQNGEKEVLKNGFLPEAVRASAAFPTLISPIKIDGKLLMDGGLADNFPVEEVIKMGADVVIGVDIQGSLRKVDKLNSAVKILDQIVGFQMYKNDKKKNALVDILIKPNVKQYSVVDFNKIDLILKEGEIAADKHFDELVELAKKQSSKKRVIKPESVDIIKIKNIKITGNKMYPDEYIKGNLEIKENDSITYKELSESVNKLFSTKEFTNIQCKIKKDKGKSNLIFNVEENPIKTNVNIAVNYNNLYKTGVLLGASSKNLLFQSDLLSADVILGDNIRYNLDYFIDNGLHWSFGVHSKLNNFSRNVYFGNNNFVHKINLFYKEHTNQLYIQTKIKRSFSFKIGIEHTHYNIYTNTVYSLNPFEEKKKIDKDYKLIFEKASYVKGISSIVLDSYDNIYFPKEGIFFKAKANWFLHASKNKKFSPFVQLSGKLGFASTLITSKFSANLEAEGGLTFGNNQNRFLNYTLGGYGRFKIANFIPFHGYDYFNKELTTPLFIKTTSTFRYEIFKKNYLKFSASSAIFDKITKDYKEYIKTGYLAGYELDSFLGPISINYAWNSEEKGGYWYFNLGYWF